MKRALLVVAILLIAAISSSPATGTSAQGAACTACVRMNEVQVLGTHNSYHLEPYAELLQLIQNFDPVAAQSFSYSHRPLDQQFSQLGIRQIELDVFVDPGPTPLFASPIGESAIKGADSVPIAAMLDPGIKVLHIQDIDYRTTCYTLSTCLQVIENWSLANPGHLPVLVLVEAKDDPLELPAGIPPAAVPLPWDATQLGTIDDTIRAVFSPGQLITPDDVRGARATLEEAVLEDGWPALDDARGKVLFALDNTDAKRDAYIADHPALQGRVMFTSSDPGTPEAAFVKLNEPLVEFDQIQSLVALGYLVRTRADADTIEARNGTTARRDAALASGAQFISTDFPAPDAAVGTGYSVAIPGGKVGRCNPVLISPDCDASIFAAFPTPVPTATATVVPPAPPATGQGLVRPTNAWTHEIVLFIGIMVAGLGALGIARRPWD